MVVSRTFSTKAAPQTLTCAEALKTHEHCSAHMLCPFLPSITPSPPQGCRGVGTAWEGQSGLLSLVLVMLP